MPPQNRERSSKERDPKKRIIFRVLIRTCQRAQQIGTKRQKYVEEKNSIFRQSGVIDGKNLPFSCFGNLRYVRMCTDFLSGPLRGC